MSQYRTAKLRVVASVGESLRIVRELQELSQNHLAKLTEISQTTISAIGSNRVNIGVERATVLARAVGAVAVAFCRSRNSRRATKPQRHPSLSRCVRTQGTQVRGPTPAPNKKARYFRSEPF